MELLSEVSRLQLLGMIFRPIGEIASDVRCCPIQITRNRHGYMDAMAMCKKDITKQLVNFHDVSCIAGPFISLLSLHVVSSAQESRRA